MRKAPVAIFLFFALIVASYGQFADPFKVEVQLEDGEIKLDATIPTNHYLYAENFKVTDARGNAQEPIELPATGSIIDPNTGHPKPVYDQSFKAIYAWKPSKGGETAIHIQYWGCNDRICFVPQTKVIDLIKTDMLPTLEKPKVVSMPDWQIALKGFEIRGSEAGYLRASPFLRFLDQAESGAAPATMSGFRLFLADPVAFVRESGLLVAILFILAGGLALNLTPCVLPLIPINMAIIGAGAHAGSKGRGFALGAAYGAGMALVYGLLGVIVVLTGSQFGTIQANPWFNLVIALIFVVLALAMFDVIHIDFSRYQTKFGGIPKKKGSFLAAFSMGSVAALLAGACVAPVVIAVLLLATNVYEANNVAGLMLPFVLGIGMALPWPFAGAGLSFIPKPGKWMVGIKYGFAIGIIFFAFYYAHLSYRAFRPADVNAMGEAKGHLIIDGATNKGFADALNQAREKGKPVFIDFWATWCKNCVVMDKTTFRDAMVKARLDGYTYIKYVAEDLGNENTEAVMDYFGVQGLPTFVVLKAK